MSAVTLPQKAGYVATTKEWDDLVRIAENLASQVVQRDAALRQMQAELDAAREHAERQQLSKDGLYRELREVSSQRDAARAAARAALENERELRKYYQGNSDVDNPLSYALAVGQLAAARAEVARLRAALTEADKSAQEMADEFYEVSEGAYLIDPVIFDAHRQAIRIALRQPAPAPATKE